MTEGSTAFSADDQSLLAEIEPRSFWFNHRNDVIAAVVRRFPPTGQIFDIGGGNGYVSLGLRNAGFDSLVVEPSETGTANARLRGLPVIRASLQEIAGSAESIPSAGMFDVLEHVEDDLAAIAALHGALARGARLYVTVPAYQALWSREDIEARHFRRYRLRHLCKRLQQGGFEINYCTYFFAPLVAPIFLMRVLKPKRKSDAHKDHALPNGYAGRLIQRALQHELMIIAGSGSRAFGSSCLAVARKAVA